MKQKKKKTKCKMGKKANGGEGRTCLFDHASSFAVLLLRTM
jgi:hypothetical protein